MRTIEKQYDSPFIADKSKVTRLMSVIQDKLNEFTLPRTEHFQVHLSSNKTFETDSLTEVFELDNSPRSRIKRLIITCGLTVLGATSPEHEVKIDFDGRPKTDVSITVRSSNTKWAMDTMSVAEEQVERTLQNEIMGKLLRHTAQFISISVMVLAMATAIFLLPDTPNRAQSPAVNTMWLTNSDLNELSVILQNPGNLSNEKATEILTRQIRNIIAQQKEAEQGKRGSSVSIFKDWRWLFIIAPILLIIASFVYVTRCYPPAVFLWGDAESWHQSLINKRKTVWSLIIGAMLIGIISNLFVFGLGGLLRP